MTTRRGLALVCLALGLVACGTPEEPLPPKATVRPVKLMTIGALGTETDITFPGRVAAGRQVDLSFRVGGPLIELPIQDGQDVVEGQIVARIDPRDFEIGLRAAQAEFDRAAADVDRLSALYEKAAVSKADLDQARAARDIAKASVDDAEADLSDTGLRAPFSSRVGEVFVENFQDIVPTQPIVSLVSVSTIEIQVDLPESLVARINAEEAAAVELVATFASVPGLEFPLRLSELASQADPRTQTYRATAIMPQPKEVNVLPGMTAEVISRGVEVGDTAGAIVIPAIAVAGGEGESAFVWVVSEADMTVERRDVTTGELIGADQIQITTGLIEGERIAVSAVSRLRAGMTIRELGE
ncbi:MAG: efflux RND transporter periplasmic adaptor subunit [Acidobacteriota bacterium]